MVWRPGLFENRILVKLWMRRGVVTAVEIHLVLLFAVVGQRLVGDLPTGNASTISERRQENRIDSPALLQNIKHPVRSFIDERDGAGLDADHFVRRDGTASRGDQGWAERGPREGPGAGAEKFPAAEVVVPTHSVSLRAQGHAGQSKAIA